MKTFEKLYMREEAQALYIQMHKHFEKTKNKDDIFKTNALNAALSISATIAQGYEQDISDVTAHLKIAKGLIGKLKSVAYLGQDLEYFTEEQTEDIVNQCGKIAAGLYKFIISKKPKED